MNRRTFLGVIPAALAANPATTVAASGILDAKWHTARLDMGGTITMEDFEKFGTMSWMLAQRYDDKW